jgi:uncharacterized OB-fold protein
MVEANEAAAGDGARDVPVVDYLVLGADPHLLAWTCTACGARYFDRRNACARCGARGDGAFERRRVATTGQLRSFTIVHRAAPGVAVPFISAVVELDDGTWVKANVVGVEPDPARLRLGMPLRLTTWPCATDSNGATAWAFGFEPVET